MELTKDQIDIIINTLKGTGQLKDLAIDKMGRTVKVLEKDPTDSVHEEMYKTMDPEYNGENSSTTEYILLETEMVGEILKLERKYDHVVIHHPDGSITGYIRSH